VNFSRVIAAFSGSPGFDFLHLIQDSASHPRFPVQGHILSAGGDALTLHALLCSTAAALTIKEMYGGRVTRRLRPSRAAYPEECRTSSPPCKVTKQIPSDKQTEWGGKKKKKKNEEKEKEIAQLQKKKNIVYAEQF
jgi:hypothetical protein